VQDYRERAEHLRLLAARLEHERDATERLAVAEEHQRMAGALHSTVSQAVRRMASRTGYAEQALDADPTRARAALAAVQDTGREAIAELHRMLRLLRDPGSPVVEPEPSIPVLVPAQWRLPVPRSARGDVLLAVSLVATSDWYLFVANPIGGPGLVVMTAAAVAAAVAITLRRRVPVSALALAAATTGVELLISAEAVSPASIVALMVTTYSVRANTLTRRAMAATAVVVVSLGVVLLLRVSFDSILVMFVWLGIPWIGQRLVRAHRRQAEQLHTLTTRLIRERDARARLAVLEERTRVARDLHDSVAHAVSVMVLQAAAAEQVMDTTPAQACTAIRAVRDQGRQAHHDLRRLVGLLAEDTAALPPSLARLDTLFSQLAQAGLPVTLAVSGEPVELPTGLDVAAYRMIQEGLTNALKHAGPVPTKVTVDYAPDTLTIEVRDPGGDPPTRPAHSGGHGLLGMHERIEHHGGTLETGPRAGGGFAVRARLPLHRAPS
jgi:signal transduction histidine kinase